MPRMYEKENRLWLWKKLSTNYIAVSPRRETLRGLNALKIILIGFFITTICACDEKRKGHKDSTETLTKRFKYSENHHYSSSETVILDMRKSPESNPAILVQTDFVTMDPNKFNSGMLDIYIGKKGLKLAFLSKNEKDSFHFRLAVNPDASIYLNIQDSLLVLDCEDKRHAMQGDLGTPLTVCFVDNKVYSCITSEKIYKYGKENSDQFYYETILYFYKRTHYQGNDKIYEFERYKEDGSLESTFKIKNLITNYKEAMMYIQEHGLDTLKSNVRTIYKDYYPFPSNKDPEPDSPWHYETDTIRH